MAELDIAFGMLLARVEHLAMAPQSVLLLPQQATDRGWTGTAVQGLRQTPQPGAYPFLVRAGIAGHLRLYETSEVLKQGQIFFSTRGRPPPGNRTRSVGRP